MHRLRLLAPCVLFCILALTSGCTESPTAVTKAGAESLEPSSSATSADDESAIMTFETLSYDGKENGDRLSLDVSVLDAVGAISPSDITGVVLPMGLVELSFFEEDGGKGELIEGAGLIKRTESSVEGLGRLVHVPVTGTRTDAQGVTEQIQGTLTINLTEGVEEPLKGDFFRSCGDECVQFDIEAVFQEAEGPAPCLLTGTFTAGIPVP